MKEMTPKEQIEKVLTDLSTPGSRPGKFELSLETDLQQYDEQIKESDLDRNKEKTFNQEELIGFWNPSVSALVIQLQNIKNSKEIFLKDLEDIQLPTKEDLKNADAFYSNIARFAVRPNNNRDNLKYYQVRKDYYTLNEKKAIKIDDPARDMDDDLFTFAIEDEKNLQYTKKKEEEDKYGPRLIMPMNTRRVEVEDLNRNFWVIAQLISSFCDFLFNPESEENSFFKSLTSEIVQIWDNVLFLWVDNYVNSFCYDDNIIKIVPFQRNLLVNKNGDFFTEEEIEGINKEIISKGMKAIKDKNPKSNLCIIPYLKINNYKKNFYSKMYLPGIYYYDRNRNEDYFREFKTEGEKLIINFDDYTTNLYAVNQDNNKIYFPYNLIKATQDGNKKDIFYAGVRLEYNQNMEITFNSTGAPQINNFFIQLIDNMAEEDNVVETIFFNDSEPIKLMENEDIFFTKEKGEPQESEKYAEIQSKDFEKGYYLNNLISGRDFSQATNSYFEYQEDILMSAPQMIKNGYEVPFYLINSDFKDYVEPINDGSNEDCFKINLEEDYGRYFWLPSYYFKSFIETSYNSGHGDIFIGHHPQIEGEDGYFSTFDKEPEEIEGEIPEEVNSYLYSEKIPIELGQKYFEEGDRPIEDYDLNGTKKAGISQNFTTPIWRYYVERVIKPIRYDDNKELSQYSEFIFYLNIYIDHWQKLYNIDKLKKRILTYLISEPIRENDKVFIGEKKIYDFQKEEDKYYEAFSELCKYCIVPGPGYFNYQVHCGSVLLKVYGKNLFNKGDDFTSKPTPSNIERCFNELNSYQKFYIYFVYKLIEYSRSKFFVGEYKDGKVCTDFKIDKNFGSFGADAYDSVLPEKGWNIQLDNFISLIKGEDYAAPYVELYDLNRDYGFYSKENIERVLANDFGILSWIKENYESFNKNAIIFPFFAYSYFSPQIITRNREKICTCNNKGIPQIFFFVRSEIFDMGDLENYKNYFTPLFKEGQEKEIGYYTTWNLNYQDQTDYLNPDATVFQEGNNYDYYRVANNGAEWYQDFYNSLTADSDFTEKLEERTKILGADSFKYLNAKDENIWMDKGMDELNQQYLSQFGTLQEPITLTNTILREVLRLKDSSFVFPAKIGNVNKIFSLVTTIAQDGTPITTFTIEDPEE